MAFFSDDSEIFVSSFILLFLTLGFWQLYRLNWKSNLIEEIRGQGFLLGIKSKINNLIFIEKLRKNGLLIIGASENVIRILPPLNVSIKELKIAINIIKKTCLDINGKKN